MTDADAMPNPDDDGTGIPSRRVVHVSELTDDEMALILAAQPEGAGYDLADIPEVDGSDPGRGPTPKS